MLRRNKRQKTVLKTYNESYIPQLGICYITIKHKNAQKICRFLVLSRNGPTSLDIPDIKVLDSLRINCSIIEESQKSNRLMRRRLKSNVTQTAVQIQILIQWVDKNKNSNKDCFLQGPNRKANRRASAKITELMHNKLPGVIKVHGIYAL